MATLYDAETFSADRAAEPRGKGSGCLKGCLIVVVILVVLAVVLGVVAFLNWRNWYAGMMSSVANQLVDDSNLPAQEKIEVKEQINRVAEEFRSGRASLPQVGLVMQQLLESSVILAMQVSTIDQSYITGSGIPDEEKAAGRQTVKRFVRGMVDDKIPAASIDAIMPQIATRRQANEPWMLKPTVTDDALRTFLAAAKAEADKAAVAAEPGEFDASDELKKVIDSSLNAPAPM